ncbi:hypothetical protein LPJ59_000791 [Coemansia sp. RSA 2399]|nr:hypothetical protein LPJ59_000791 [Coemansia sp. RSA 2399]
MALQVPPQQHLHESTFLNSGGHAVDSEIAYTAPSDHIPRHSRSHSNIQYSTTYQRQHAFNDTYFARTADPPPMPAAVSGSYIMDKYAAISPQTPPSPGDHPNDTSWFKDQRPPPMPGSDSKYSAYTVAARGSEHRRVRGQRRRTDCSDELQASIRRPSSSHSSSLTSRKVTYSQYPDFETITDPFAKRDKIPQKSIKPVLSNTSGSDTKPPNPDDRSGTASSSPTLQPPPVPQMFAEQGANAAAKMAAKSHGNSKENSRLLLGLAQQRNGVPAKHTHHPSSMSIALRKQQAYAAEPVQMESLDSSLPGSPAPSVPRQPNDSHADQAVVPTGNIPPSPLSQASQPPLSASRAVDMHSSRKESLPPHLLDVDTAVAGPALIRPFSGQHLNSPRLDIDMDKVETLYARSSVIFEKNKQRREARSRVDSAVAEPDSSAYAASARKGRYGLLGATSNDRASSLSQTNTSANKHIIADNRYNDEYDNDDIDNLEGHHEGDDYIPFDQVLIPTAFKRLRAAIDDPEFEIDEETYRRFKLSERWYAREVHAQMERTYAIGTFGESKDRGRASRKDHSGGNAELYPRADPSDIDPAVYRNHRLVDDTGDGMYQDIPMAPISPPERKRTSSRRRSQRSAAGSSSGTHRRYPVPAEDVPQMPQAVSPRAHHRPVRGNGLVRKETYSRDADSAYVPPQLQTDMRQDSLNYAAALSGQTGTSSHMRRGAPIHHQAHAIRRSERMDPQQPPEQKSSGCCGCTIM